MLVNLVKDHGDRVPTVLVFDSISEIEWITCVLRVYSLLTAGSSQLKYVPSTPVAASQFRAKVVFPTCLGPVRKIIFPAVISGSKMY